MVDRRGMAARNGFVNAVVWGGAELIFKSQSGSRTKKPMLFQLVQDYVVQIEILLGLEYELGYGTDTGQIQRYGVLQVAIDVADREHVEARSTTTPVIHLLEAATVFLDDLGLDQEGNTLR